MGDESPIFWARYGQAASEDGCFGSSRSRAALVAPRPVPPNGREQPDRDVDRVPVAVGALVPPHIHHLEDEYSIVLEGEIGFRSNDQEVVLGPGGYIVKPRGEVHAMWNAGSTPARMIEVISPAGFEGFFRELTDMTAIGAPDPAAIAALGERYQLPFAQPDWLPDVIARYHLTSMTR